MHANQVQLFHDLEHLLKCTTKVFGTVAVSEIKIFKKNFTDFQYKFAKLFF